MYLSWYGEVIGEERDVQKAKLTAKETIGRKEKESETELPNRSIVIKRNIDNPQKEKVHKQA